MKFIESNEGKYQRAKKRIEALKGFYTNLVAYCIVIPFLIFLNYISTDFPWAIFPAMGWGLGLTVHGFEAHGQNPLYGKKWEERKMEELMNDSDF